MGSHVYHNHTSTPVGKVAGNALWPTCHLQYSGLASKLTNTNHSLGRQTVVVPDFVSKPHDYLPLKYGYQEVHAIYDKMRDFFAKRATSTYQNEVPTIKVTLMMMKTNCWNPQMVMVSKNMASSVYDSMLIIVKDITEMISNIPLHIGVSHLKAIAYFTIFPLFLKWSNDYSLSIDDIKLHIRKSTFALRET